MLYRIDLKSGSNDAPAIVDTFEFGTEDNPGSISLDLDGDYAFVSLYGVLYKVQLNGPAGIMAVVESLDLSEETGESLSEFPISLYDPPTGLLYMGPCKQCDETNQRSLVKKIKPIINLRVFASPNHNPS